MTGRTLVLVAVIALVGGCSTPPPAVVEYTPPPATAVPQPNPSPSYVPTPTPKPTPKPTPVPPPGVMYVPLTGIRSSGDTVSYGDEWDMLLTVGNKGKGPTKQVSADVRPIPPPLGLDLGQILGLLSCTPKCNYTSNGVGGWFVRWPPLKPNTKQTYKIRFMVSTYQTGYVNIGVIVFEGTSTNVSSESPETKGYDGFQITIQ